MRLQDSSPDEFSTKDLFKEFLRRRTVRERLIEWARFHGFEPARHHRFIIAQIESFLESDDEILLLFAPPGSAKSEYLSKLFPTWYLSRYPGNSILAATHSVEFAQRWGRRCRNDIALYGQILGIALSDDSSASDRWALKSGGEYYGVGAGVGIAGFRADLGLGDDFFGSREDAWSETVRKKRWEWYVDDFSARLKPGAKRILMNTRWHPEDVAGRVLQQIQDGKVRGRVISLPAIAEAGDALGREVGQYLWDDQPGYDYPSFLKARRAESTPMMWSALYQQRPSPEEGSYFKREWFKRFALAQKPAALHVYITGDFATKEGEGDWTTFQVWGVDTAGDLWLLDLWRAQATADVWIERLIDIISKHKPLCFFGEGGVIARAIEPMLRRRMTERRAGCRLEWIPSITDKPTRARGFQSRAAMGKVHICDGSDGDLLIDELLHFPAGKWDDGVDAAGLIGRALDDVHPAIAKRSPGSHGKNPADLNQWRRERPSGDWKTL